MKKMATIRATAPPTPKATPTDCSSESLILAEPPFQTMSRARRKDVRKTVGVSDAFRMWIPDMAQLTIKGNHDEGLLDRVVAAHDTILGDQENDGTEDTRDTRSNTPGSEYLRHTFEAPVDTIDSSRSNAHTNDTTHNRVSR